MTQPSPPHQGYILLVDDDPSSAYIARSYLTHLNYRVEWSDNGAMCVDELSATLTNEDIGALPDLIILDLNMPHMDGYEVLAWRKTLPNIARIPVIILTGQIDRESRLKALQMGADEFLTKPLDRKELEIRVQTILTMVHQRRRLETAADRINNLQSELVSLAQAEAHYEAMRATAGAACHALNQPLTVLQLVFDTICQSHPIDPTDKTLFEDAFARVRVIMHQLGNLEHFETHAYSQNDKILDLNRASVEIIK